MTGDPLSLHARRASDIVKSWMMIWAVTKGPSFDGKQSTVCIGHKFRIDKLTILCSYVSKWDEEATLIGDYVSPVSLP
jgi:hypothetical protein